MTQTKLDENSSVVYDKNPALKEFSDELIQICELALDELDDEWEDRIQDYGFKVDREENVVDPDDEEQFREDFGEEFDVDAFLKKMAQSRHVRDAIADLLEKYRQNKEIPAYLAGTNYEPDWEAIEEFRQPPMED